MFFFRLLSRLPFGVLYLIADLLFLVLYRVIRYRRGVVEDNLRHAFPAREAREIRQLGKAYYRHLSQVVVEILKMLTISEQEIRKRIELEHADIVQNYIRGGSSVLILASHLCNWEWIASALRLHAGCEAAGVYKPLSNPLFDRLMIDVRNRFGNTPLIPKETAVRDILRMHKKPILFGLVADQSPAAPDAKYWTTFLGRETAFFVGPSLLTQLTGMPTVYADMQRIGKGRYRITMSKLSEPPYEKDNNEVLDLYIRRLEQSIRESPADWLWSHRRWKHERGPHE
jgi:Kdo2-lipid IVA lauroyltransferase/acyltransferase